jgi:hypothetical protein
VIPGFTLARRDGHTRPDPDRVARGSLRRRPREIARLAAKYGVVFVFSGALTGHAAIAERLGVQRLRDELPAGSAIVLDPATDAVLALRGLDLALAGAGRDPGAAAARWLADHARAFGLSAPDDDVVVERVERGRNGAARVLLRQRWRGFPVHGGDARLVLSAAGRLHAVAAGFVPGITAGDGSRLSRDDAVRRGAAALGASLRLDPAVAERWVRRDGDADRLAWRIAATLADGRPATAWVDAATGAIVARDDGITHAVGLAYPTDPRQALAEVPLHGLGAGPGLTNEAFAVEDQQDPLVAPIGPDGDYRFLPTEPGFNQVNAYWHSDLFLNGYLAGHGHAGLPEPLVVRVNVPLEPNVALTTGTFVLLGRPIAGFAGDAARSHDIIYHELVHAVLYAAGVQPGGTRRESGALHEGLADFFSAAFTGDAAIGEWLYLTFPAGATRVDQPADRWNMARYDQVSFAGAPTGSTWANGMILSGALWDLRGAIGAACDSLVLEAMEYLPSQPAWAHLANGMLQADETLHGSRHREAIRTALAARGIRGTVTMPARIGGPAVLKVGETGTFFADPCCGVQQGYRWSARPWCRGRPCGGWRDLGEGPELSAAFDEDTELRLMTRSPWDDVLEATRFIGVRPPALVVEGPRRVLVNQPATWTARPVAMGPVRIQWQRRSLPGPPVYDFLGEGPALTYTPSAPCELVVTLLDGLVPPRSVREFVTVETFADEPPSPAIGEIRVRQRMDGRARAVETLVEVPRAGPLRMRIYDVRGRLRMRLWDGPAARGAHVVRWDASALEPGLYLLRVEGEPTGTVVRFTLLR